MDCVVTPLKTLMGFSVYLNVQLKFYNLPFLKLGKTLILPEIETKTPTKPFVGVIIFYEQRLNVAI